MGQSPDKDVQTYRDGYPDLEDDLGKNKNLEFYQNEIKSEPHGDYIDVIHEKWKGEYDLLEQHHGYIQWLFPIQENGLNWQAQRAHKHELEAIANDEKMKERVVKSYALMLDFFGMKIEDEKTGELGRTDNFEDRYENLNTSFHNYLRITRILKFLGEVGFEHYKLPFLKHIFKEIENGHLPRCLNSLTDYWYPVLRLESEREECAAALEKMKNEGKLPERRRRW